MAAGAAVSPAEFADMPELLYVIDVYSLLFQVFHAIAEMTGPSGQPTNALFGFTRDILNLLQQKRPTHLLCALDVPGQGEREVWYPAYKANRSEMPDSLRPQVPMLHEMLEAFRIPMLAHVGWEADDVIATVTEQAVARGMHVCVVTNDKDARQLVSPQVRIFNIRKESYLGEQELLQDWGVRPDQVVDYQALVGDSVDNVPGVPLIGPKKATALLQQFGTLEDVLANASAAPGAKLRENLVTFAEQARLSRRLVQLRRDLPLDIDWHAAQVGHHDIPRLQQLFTKFGFRRFGDEVKLLPVAAEDAALAAPEAPHKRPLTFHVVDTPARLADFLDRLRKQRRFCLDLETNSIDTLQADIVGWAFSWEPHVGWYLPVQGPPGASVLDNTEVVAALRPILESEAVEVVNQNLKYEILVLRNMGIRVRNLGMDPMVASYLLDAGARSHSLDELARRYLQHETIPISSLIGKGLFRKGIDEVEVELVAEYAAEDAETAWELSQRLEAELRREGLYDLYWTLERPLIGVLAEMKSHGICVNASLLENQSRQITQQLGQLEQELYRLAGRQFNVDSPLQLREILFDELGLPVLRKTKTGASTDQDVLEELARLHELPAKMLEHRQLNKLKSTYLDALPGMVNPRTGRIHCTFNQVVAATGRLSSSDPNLQNIPIRTAEGRRIRQAFEAPGPDWRLLCADYSQIELRLLAHFSQDEELRAAFAQNIDIHAAVAAEIYGVDLRDVSSDQRHVAKAVNFGVLYGQSPFGLAAHLGISKSDAAEFIDNYFRKYRGVEAFLTRLLEECAATGYAVTILGHRRPITGIRSTKGRQRNLPERTAINTVIQGSAADLIKRAMLAIHDRMTAADDPARMLLQIHDELVFECPTSRVPETARLVRDEMVSALSLSVPLQVDVVAGPNWLDVEPVPI